MKGTTLVMCVTLIALFGCAYASCDPWGARKCGEEFFDCYNNTIQARWPSDLICQCYAKQGTCLRKYKCSSGPTLAVFKTNCLAQKCAEYQCSGASGVTVSFVAVVFALLLALF